MLERLFLFLFLVLGISGLGAGCDDDSSSLSSAEEAADESNAINETDEENDSDETGADLTGEWQRTTAPSIYRLRHTGVSIQGIYYEPNDTNVSGRIAGSVDGDDVEMDIVVTYTDGVRSNFVAHKSGGILNRDHMRLKVIDSPVALGQVQDWFRR